MQQQGGPVGEVCHGRVRNPDSTGRIYEEECYSCRRKSQGHSSEFSFMIAPVFYPPARCPMWEERKPFNEATDRWPEER